MEKLEAAIRNEKRWGDDVPKPGFPWLDYCAVYRFLCAFGQLLLCVFSSGFASPVEDSVDVNFGEFSAILLLRCEPHSSEQSKARGEREKARCSSALGYTN